MTDMPSYKSLPAHKRREHRRRDKRRNDGIAMADAIDELREEQGTIEVVAAEVVARASRATAKTRRIPVAMSIADYRDNHMPPDNAKSHRIEQQLVVMSGRNGSSPNKGA